jgi:serine/threonine-protein kinase
MSADDAGLLFPPARWRTIREAVARIEQLPEAERDGALAALAVADADLAASVRTLLGPGEERDELRDAVERMMPEAQEPMPAAVGPFRPVRRIGAGGMGVVYLAERGGADFTQRVALKLLDGGDAWRMARMAARERRILSGLAHPNITAFVDAGIDGGRAWLAMEYVDGVPLLDWCAQRQLDVRERVRLFDQVCAAVAHAHAQLVVHRDLKPSNVLVSSDGTVKLLDFGIALALDPGEDQTPATRVFTPEYAAPEQLRGERVTTATDIHALGLVLFELVSGNRLPTLDRAPDAGWTTQELSRQAAGTTPTTTATTDPMRRLLRGDLGRIIAHALAPDPARRYASVALLRDDLARWLEYRPLGLTRPGFGYTVSRFVRRHRAAVAVSFVAFAALLGTTAFALWQAHERSMETTRAQAQTQYARAMREFMTAVIDAASPNVNQGHPITPLLLIEKSEQQLDRFAGAPNQQADVMATLAKRYIDYDARDRAGKLLERARALLPSPEVSDEVRAHVYAASATLDIAESKFEAAATDAARAAVLLDALPEPDHKILASYHMVTAQALDGLNDPARSEAFLRESVRQDEAALGDSVLAVTEQWALLGWALGQQGRFDEAQQAYAHALAGSRKREGDDGFQVGHVYHEMSLVYAKANDLGKAEETGREALRIYRAVLGPDHDRTLNQENSMLGLVERQGRIAEALQQREQLIGRASKPGVSAPRRLAGYLQVIGHDYALVGRFDDAEKALRQSLALGEQAQGKGALVDQDARCELGSVLTLSGRYDEAESVLRETLAIEREKRSASAVDTPRRLTEMLLGDLLRRRHRLQDALETLHRAADFPASVAANDTTRPLVLARLSEAELDAGDVTAAAADALSASEFARKAFVAHDIRNGYVLYALGRAQLAARHDGDAKGSLDAALAVRVPPQPDADPEVLEVKVALAAALAAEGRRQQAQALAAAVTPLLVASASPYATDLRQRLPH